MALRPSPSPGVKAGVVAMDIDFALAKAVYMGNSNSLLGVVCAVRRIKSNLLKWLFAFFCQMGEV